MTARERSTKTADTLYDRYGKPLEAEHRGEYVAISPDGKTVLGRSLLDVVQKAKAEIGPGTYTFRIGPRVVGKWR